MKNLMINETEEKEEVLYVRDYFRGAFIKLYEENKKENIKLEQYTANIAVMLEIAKVLKDDFEFIK